MTGKTKLQVDGNKDELLTYIFSDNCSLVWIKSDKRFVYLNQISTWIRASLERGLDASEVVEILVEENTMNRKASENLVNSISDFHPATISALQAAELSASDDSTVDNEIEIPFDEYLPDLSYRTSKSSSFSIKTGGVIINIELFDESIDLTIAADFFTHLIHRENSELPTYSINIGRIETSSYWIHCETTEGYIAKSNEELLTLLYWMIYKTVETSRNWLITLHAGGVVAAQDKALILCGPSGSGKSTLTATLMDRYKSYLSDEVIPITREQHDIYSVPTSTCIKENAWPALHTVYPKLSTVKPMKRLGKNIKYLPIGQNIFTPEKISADGSILLFPQFTEATHMPASSRVLNVGEILDNFLNAGALIGRINTQLQFDDLCSWLENIEGYELQYRTTNQALELIDALPVPGCI